MTAAEGPTTDTMQSVLEWCTDFAPGEEIHVVEHQNRAGYIVKKGTGDRETRHFVSYETAIRIHHLMGFLR